MKLIREIRSSFRSNVIYGHAGEEVKLVSMHDDVLIVEGERGNRFSVKMEDINANDRPVEIIEPVILHQPVETKSRKQKKATPEQATMF